MPKIKSYRELNPGKLEENKKEVQNETISQYMSRIGKKGGKMSVFSRFGNKTKEERSEMMKKVWGGKKKA